MVTEWLTLNLSASAIAKSTLVMIVAHSARELVTIGHDRSRVDGCRLLGGAHRGSVRRWSARVDRTGYLGQLLSRVLVLEALLDGLSDAVHGLNIADRGAALAMRHLVAVQAFTEAVTSALQIAMVSNRRGRVQVLVVVTSKLLFQKIDASDGDLITSTLQ